MRRLILHIGAPKCGSTYLQRVLLKNQKRLLENDICYPHLGHGHPGNGEVIYDLTERWLNQQFERASTVILSHELLFASAARAGRPRTLADRLRFQIDIVAFLRPFDEIIMGDYSQNLRQNLPDYVQSGLAFHGRSFRQFAWARQKDIQPAGFLTAWAKVLPQAHFHVAQHRNIREVFQRLAPKTASMDWRVPHWRTNPSLSRTACSDIISAAMRGNDTPGAATLPLTPATDARLRSWVRSIFEPQRAALLRHFNFDINAIADGQPLSHVA